MFFHDDKKPCGWCGRVEGVFGFTMPIRDHCITRCKEYRRDMEMLGLPPCHLVGVERTEAAIYIVGGGVISQYMATSDMLKSPRD